jgi:ectoine hydroxylase-related dioxygenase (phytanoyl-CoA dioxygenase family)
MTAVAQAVRASAEPPLDEWIARFHRDGYLVVEDALPADLLEGLRRDLDVALGGPPTSTGKVEIAVRMFEQSGANLRLFDHEPVVTFAERLISEDRPALGPDHVHVVHNNAFRTPSQAGISTWHQDVPGSHLFGAHCPPTLEGSGREGDVVTAYGKAGTAIMFSCQLWHRGHPNMSERTRYVAQVSYAHRIIGHRYFPFMNYVMPEHVYADANPRLRRLLGFLPTGAYG